MAEINQTFDYYPKKFHWESVDMLGDELPFWGPGMPVPEGYTPEDYGITPENNPKAHLFHSNEVIEPDTMANRSNIANRNAFYGKIVVAGIAAYCIWKFILRR